MKPFIGGKKITKKKALKDLGDPKKWEKQNSKTYEEFRKKPRG